MFEPKADKAQWRLIYDLLADLPVGGTVTYDAMSEAIGQDIRANRGPIYRATKQLEEEHRRTIISVPRIGYRIAQAAEHEDLARSHHKRARKQVAKSYRKLHSADRAALTPEQRHRFDRLEVTVSRQADMIRRLDARVTRHDTAIKDGRRTTKELEARVADLAERMTRAGITTGEAASQ